MITMDSQTQLKIDIIAKGARGNGKGRVVTVVGQLLRQPCIVLNSLLEKS